MLDFFKSKAGMWTAGIVLLLVVLYFIWKDDVDAYYHRMMGHTTDGDPSTMNLNTSTVLKKGMMSPEVKALQNGLIQQGANLPKYGADGVFGNETEVALKEKTGTTKISLDGFNALFANVKAAPEEVAQEKQMQYN